MHHKTLIRMAAFFALLIVQSALSFSVDKDQEPNFITFSKIDGAWKYTKGENTTVAVLDWLFDLSPEASKKYILPAMNSM